MRVTERPPLRVTVDVTTPRGRSYRWAADDPNPENIPRGLRSSSTMPGGFEACDTELARDPARDFPDLEPLSTITVRDAAMQPVWEGRLERAPRTSGDRLAISPSAVGFQAHLDDDKSASMVWIDRDLSAWGEASSARQLELAEDDENYVAPTVGPNKKTGLPRMTLKLPGPHNSGSHAEALYDAGAGNLIGAVYYAWYASSSVQSNSNWQWLVETQEFDDYSGGSETSGDLRSGSASGTGVLTPAAAYRYARAYVEHLTSSAGSTHGPRGADWELAVFGDHDLDRQGAAPYALLASDIVAHAVRAFAPMLEFTTGTDGTISPSTVLIPHLVHRDKTTAGQMVKDAAKFELLDWAVWEARTFWLHQRGARGRSWRARVGPAGLEETGPQVDRVWESVIVSYQDVDGTTRTVGPEGSGADTETDMLVVDDPENPATRLGITRRDILQMGVGTADTATEVGRLFLEEAKLLDSSGRATLTGWVEDDRGVIHPYSHVRAGDTVSFVDAGDHSPRRVVKADADHDAKTVTVDLDAPPEALGALLERLNVVLVPLGIS